MSYASSAGNANASPIADATQASPPEVTAKRALVSAATTPDSMSPKRGPLVTTIANVDDIDRAWLGRHAWLMTERQTALIVSAAPAIASIAAAGHSDGIRPLPAIASAPDDTAAT